MDTPQQYPTMWTTGYLPNGAKVSFTFPIRNTFEAYKEAVDITNKLLADGFMLTEPGLEAGEKKEQVGYVLRRSKDDGTAVLDLYPANDKTSFRFVMCYLDTPEDIAEFENATGLVFKSLPVYEGDRMERGNNEKSNKYIVKVPQVTNAVIKDNPYYNPTETDVKKKKPARLFVRWEGSQPTPTPQPPPPAANVAASEPEPARNGELRNELIMISTIEPRPDSKGFYGHGLFSDGIGQHEVRVNLFLPEDKKLIEDAGYEWVASGAVSWPVTLRIDRNMTRIATVTPIYDVNADLPPLSAIAGHSANEPAWFGTRVIECWGILKTYLLANVYAKNTFAMKGSLVKRGIVADKDATIPSGDWAQRTAGDLVRHLQTRHDNKQPIAEAS